MLTRVNLAENNSCYPTRLRKLFRQGVQYKTYGKFVPQTTKATVGNLPAEIIELFKPSERAEKVTAFQKVLADTAKFIRTIHDENMVDLAHDDKFCVDNILDCKGIEANKMLHENLKGILPDGYKANLEYVDYGGFKDVYKLGVSDENGKKIMHDKAFHVYRNLSETGDYGYQHGIWAEPNMWIYMSYRAGHPLDKTQFTKHYLSDLHAGYSITEYADYNITKTTSPFRVREILGLRYKDIDHNPLLHKKVYDVGGFVKSKFFTDDKLVSRYYKQIFNRNTEKEKEQVISQLEAKIKNPKTPHRDKMQKGIDLYREKSELERKRQESLQELIDLL